MSEPVTGPSSSERIEGQVRVWDLPTRLFKWALVVLVAFAWCSQEWAEQLHDLPLRLHKINGYAILILLLFRILWGFVGGSTARFTTWIRGPVSAFREAIDGLRGRHQPWLSHTPLSGWMVLALMLFLLAQGIAGLFSSDSNGIFGGPFGHTDPLEDPTPLQARMDWFHHHAFNIILALAAVHIAAALLHQFVVKDGLISRMISGRTPAQPFRDAPELVPAKAQWFRAAACLAFAAAVVLGGVKLAGGSLL